MATIKQKRFAAKVLENVRGVEGPKSLEKIAKESGYAETISKQPSRIMKSRGVLKIFERAGITPQSIAEQWNLIIKAPLKEKVISYDAKIKALTQLNKVFGLETQQSRLHPKIEFINQFIKTQELGINKPRFKKSEIKNNE